MHFSRLCSIGNRGERNSLKRHDNLTLGDRSTKNSMLVGSSNQVRSLSVDGGAGDQAAYFKLSKRDYP